MSTRFAIMHLAIFLPDWNSLDSVRRAHSDLEGIALVFFALLVGFDLMAHLSSGAREKRLEKIGLFCFAIAIVAEMVAYPYGERNDTLSEQIIGSLDAKARVALTNSNDAETKSADAVVKAGQAQTKAETAETAAGRAAISARDAKGQAGKAQQEAGDVAKEADELNHEVLATKTALSTVEAKRAELEKSLTDMAVCNAPRIINPWYFTAQPPIYKLKSYVDPLRPTAGQMVFIEFVPDAEARRAALNIERTLRDAKWNIQPLKVVDGLADGVSVQTRDANDAADKLRDFLHSYNWQAAEGPPLDSQGKVIHDNKMLPAGAIRIQVGLYPPAVYVSPPPPGQKEFNSSMEEMNREQKRMAEESLATLPPENRQKIRQGREEFFAKIRNENGPCQAMNPPLPF